MSTFRLIIDMDNAAFEPIPQLEVWRIIKELRGFFEDAPHELDTRRPLRDANGNAVGYFEATDCKDLDPDKLIPLLKQICAGCKNARLALPALDVLIEELEAATGLELTQIGELHVWK